MVAGVNVNEARRHAPETKEAARKLCEEGKTPRETAEALGVPEGTVRAWASRGGWLMPLSVVGRNRLARELAQATRESAAEKWAGRWDGAREQVHGLILSALTGANLPAPKNWQELSVAVETLRKICGASDAGAAGPAAVVQIGIAPMPSAAAGVVVQ